MAAVLPPPDLEAYLARIGYAGSRAGTADVLGAIHAAHAASIPFENLDILLGRTIATDLPAITRKLVHDRRGGYCFEQNALLGAALRALLARSGSVDAARAKAVAIVEEAKRLLPETRRAHSRELLLELADRVVARDA